VALSTSSTDLLERWSYVDWEDLSNLDRVVAVYEVGQNSVVVDAGDGREIRITAWRNMASGEYVADFEKRSAVRVGTQELRVWAHTPAYARCAADDLKTCLEQAVLEVDRVSIY
jgi:hypothetical protein